MQFVELLLTDEHALKTALAIDLVLQDEERFVMTDEEREAYTQLAQVFTFAAANPHRFAPSGHLAQTVKEIRRKARGQAQPQSRRNRRKARQEARMGFAKRRRKERRAEIESWNAAVEQMQRDREDAEAYEREMIERYESEPKFTIRAGDGTIIMQGVPQSAIEPDTVEAEPEAKPHVILPGTAEALGVQLD